MKDSQILSKILVDNYWHLVGHKSELMNDKDYIKLDLLNRNIVVFNDFNDIFLNFSRNLKKIRTGYFCQFCL